jgi:hypothetical protein
VASLQAIKSERSSSAPSLGAEIDEEVLAELPTILKEAQDTPEYQKLWWAWSVLSSAAVAVGGMV